MKSELQENLVTTCPLLYKHYKGNSQMQIDCPDDLFEFIFELSGKIEDFNRRFPKRRVRAMKVAMEYGEFVFVTNKQVFTVQKLIAATTSQIRSYRRNLKQALLERAKAIGTTALFGSSLIPDWKRLMPDDTDTLRKILEYAEKRAIVPQDHTDLTNWYKKYLKIDKSKEVDNAIL
ncbi:MAG: hypothetical protein IJW31_03885 [Lentisphaeria bacterium]|nr:hypothetical protein [Lentisphaeria bacterium]